MIKKILLLFGLIHLNAYSQSYTADASFGSNGSKAYMGFSSGSNTNPESGPIEIYYINNKYILIQEYQIARFDYNGNRDFTFGLNGKCILNGNDKYFKINSVKMHLGNFYVCGQVGISSFSNTDAFIAKISTDGILDTTFGNQGITIVDFGNDTGNLPDDDQFQDLTIRPDGSLYTIAGIRTGSNDTDLIVAKFTPSGLPDTTFDPTGFKSYNSEGNYTSTGKKIFDYQNGILALGSKTQQNITQRILFKIDENGTVDTSFATGGYYNPPTFSDAFLENNLMTFSYGLNGVGGFNTINLDNFQSIFNSGNIMLTKPIVKFKDNKVWATDITCQGMQCLSGIGFKLRRFNMDGSIDTSFNSTGIYTYNFPGINPFFTFSHPSAVYFHDDGKILIVGKVYYESGPNGLGMLRITEGTLDLQNPKGIKFSVIPNPASDFLTILNPSNALIDKVFLSDMSGRIINVSFSANKIDISQYQAGIYMLHLISGNESTTVKFVIQ